MKAQITIFIIIGIMVVAAFGITLYIGSKKMETPQTTKQLGMQPIQDYVNSCLKISTEEGLKLISKQGGTIYTSQGGTTPDEQKEHVQYVDEQGTTNIPFLITPPEGNVGTIFYSEPPEYPFPGFPYPPEETNPLYTGYYGMSQLPPLYKKTLDGKDIPGSIQENLEKYIAKKTTECTDWKTFQDYTIEPGQAEASLVFATKQEQFAGEQYITVELNWPIQVTTPGGTTPLKDFAIREPIRLATIYYKAKSIIDAEATDTSYEPEATPPFSITTQKKGEDKIQILTDEQSKTAGKTLEFYIPIKNRKPALWHIDTKPLEEITFHVTPEGRGAEIAVQGNELSINDPCPDFPNPYTINLTATDPDEDNTTFDVYPNEIHQEAPGQKFTIRVYAKDTSANPAEWFDYQDVLLQVAQCPVR